MKIYIKDTTKTFSMEAGTRVASNKQIGISVDSKHVEALCENDRLILDQLMKMLVISTSIL